MRTQTIFCTICKEAVYKIRAQTGKGDLELGTYCVHCKKIFNIEGVPLIPRPSLPGKEEVKKALGGLEPIVLPGCSIRDPNDSRLDRDLLKKDLQKEFQNIH